MSLGGPVHVGRQRIAGAIFLALLGGAVAAVLALSGRSAFSGVHFEVELASPGALRVGAHILLAGREVGEVRGLRRLPPSPTGERHVVAECFVVRAWARHVLRNSDLFISTPSILGEAALEVGAPRDGAAPGAPIAEGERLRGSDPPEIDKLLQKMYASTVENLMLLRAHRAELDELLANIDSLMSTVSGIPVEKGQLVRIRDGALHAFEDGTAIYDAIRDSRTAPRARAIAADLARTVDDLRPELRALGEKADRAAANASALSSLVAPDDRARVEGAFHALAEAARRGEKLADSVSQIASYVDRGEGSVGGFLHDKELWDDLHETHRILKWKGWRLILKTKPGTPTAPE